MSLFGGVISISNISTLLFVVFAVLMAGYALGRITVKGISLGDAGVFIIALVAGALFFHVSADHLGILGQKLGIESHALFKNGRVDLRCKLGDGKTAERRKIAVFVGQFPEEGGEIGGVSAVEIDEKDLLKAVAGNFGAIVFKKPSHNIGG